MAQQSLKQFMNDLPKGEALLIIKNGNREDLDIVVDSIKHRNIPILNLSEFKGNKETTTFVLSLPPKCIQDILFRVVGKGLKGEIEGYEVESEKSTPRYFSIEGEN